MTNHFTNADIIKVYVAWFFLWKARVGLMGTFVHCMPAIMPPYSLDINIWTYDHAYKHSFTMLTWPILKI